MRKALEMSASQRTSDVIDYLNENVQKVQNIKNYQTNKFIQLYRSNHENLDRVKIRRKMQEEEQLKLRMF